MNLTGSTLAESMPALRDIPLSYQPGSKWVYSISVDVQGYMVERLSGIRFGEFLETRIFQPLGMVDTGFFVEPENAARLSRQYAPNNDGTLRRTDNRPGLANFDFLSPPKFESGGGGLTSTATDYMKFVQMHLNDGELNGVSILSVAAVAQMRAIQLPWAVGNIGQLYPGNVFGLILPLSKTPIPTKGPRRELTAVGHRGVLALIDPVENIGFIGMMNDDILYSLRVHAAARAAIYE